MSSTRIKVPLSDSEDKVMVQVFRDIFVLQLLREMSSLSCYGTMHDRLCCRTIYFINHS